MLHLLWAFINIALLFLFIVICFRAVGLVKEKFGLFASIIFIVGLLSSMRQPKDDENIEPGKNEIKKWRFTPEDSLEMNSIKHISLKLDDNLVSQYDLGITYGKHKEQNLYVPVNAYSSTTGLISGIYWKPASIIVNQTTGNTFPYYVDGTEEWRLLGIRLYNKSITYKGFAVIK